MKTDTLINAIGMIDDKYITEAKSATNKKGNYKKIILLFAAVLLCISLSLSTITSANIGSFYDLLYPIAPAFAQQLRPINKSDIDQGIQVEVVSAKIKNNKAEIFVALKDITDNRLDKTTDLFDSYNIRTSYDSIGTCNFIKYDKNTGVATFLIHIEHMDDKKIDKNIITFSISQILSQKTNTEIILSNIDLSKTNKNPETNISNKYDVRGVAISTKNGEDPDEKEKEILDKTLLLTPTSGEYTSKVKGAEISAIGYINNQLHIQVCYKNILKTDNHGFISLRNKSSNKEFDNIEPSFDISFWDKNESDSYDEYVFDIPFEDLKNYEIFAEFTTCENYIEGDWEITFPLKDAQ